jgi:CheY-like chemotaxis protein
MAHGLDDRLAEAAKALIATAGPETGPGPTFPTREQELDWLSRSVPAELTHVGEVIGEVFLTVAPLAESEGVAMMQDAPDAALSVRVPQIILKQALLHTLTTAIHCASGGRVSIVTEAGDKLVTIRIYGQTADATSPVLQRAQRDRLDMSRQLIELADGTLDVSAEMADGVPLEVSITLRRLSQPVVLVVDDNADTRRLFERYLSGTPYLFVGTGDPQKALSLAQTHCPRLVIVDVMMPGTDGWKLLAHLRQNPETSGIPVAVCTILSEEDLALTLGAAEFIQKPVTRVAFLAMLERHIQSTS